MYRRLLGFITGGKKPSVTVEDAGAVEYDTGKGGGIVGLTLWGDTSSTSKSGYPSNTSTFHIGTYDAQKDCYIIRLRFRGEVFLDGEEFERLLALTNPTLYGGRTEDGKIILLTKTTNPSTVIAEEYFRSLKLAHTVHMDIRPENAVNSNVCANMCFGYDAGSYTPWTAPPNGLNEVHVTVSSTKKQTISIKNSKSYKVENRFFINPDTFCIARSDLQTPPIGEKCNPDYIELGIREPLRGVKGADGTYYRDRYDVTKGHIERVVRKIRIDSPDAFERFTDTANNFSYYKVTLPTPVLNSAVDSNMFKIYVGTESISSTNRIYLDPEGRYFIFKYKNEIHTDSQLSDMITNAPFEFYWYDGNTTVEAVEPTKIGIKRGHTVMEVCSRSVAPIRLEYTQ